MLHNQDILDRNCEIEGACKIDPKYCRPWRDIPCHSTYPPLQTQSLGNAATVAAASIFSSSLDDSPPALPPPSSFRATMSEFTQFTIADRKSGPIYTGSSPHTGHTRQRPRAFLVHSRYEPVLPAKMRKKIVMRERPLYLLQQTGKCVCKTSWRVSNWCIPLCLKVKYINIARAVNCTQPF